LKVSSTLLDGHLRPHGSLVPEGAPPGFPEEASKTWFEPHPGGTPSGTPPGRAQDPVFRLPAGSLEEASGTPKSLKIVKIGRNLRIGWILGIGRGPVLEPPSLLSKTDFLVPGGRFGWRSTDILHDFLDFEGVLGRDSYWEGENHGFSLFSSFSRKTPKTPKIARNPPKTPLPRILFDAISPTWTPV